jgi:spore germination protein GerM
MMRGLSMIVACTLMFALAGCGEKTNSSPTDTQMKAKQPSEPTSTVASQVPAEQPKAEEQNTGTAVKNQMTVKVYYPDKQAIDVVEKTKEIHWAADETKYGASFKALFTAPDSNLVALWKEQPFKMKFEGGTLSIDLSKPAATGSTGERLMVLSLLKTMFQFSEVQKVQILIGGKPAESLSGHLDIQKPFTRNSLADL